MRVPVRRVAVLALALALTLGALFGAQHWLFLTQTKAPLQTEIRRLHGVTAVTLNLTASSPSVTVRLGNVSNLQSTYQTISQKIHSLAPGATLKVQGTSDAALANAAQVLSFAIEQGIATGQFVQMRKDVLSEAAKLHITAKVYVDSKYVYVALYDHSRSAYFVYSRGGS